jgi:hypothetical protein
MARSDNTEWKPGMTGLAKHWATFSMPRGTGRYLRRRWQKQQRQRERGALRRGAEPEPSRPRGSVRYDYW